MTVILTWNGPNVEKGGQAILGDSPSTEKLIASLKKNPSVTNLTVTRTK